MGSDKALLDLGGMTAIERAVKACSEGGVDQAIIVRRAGAAPLPAVIETRVVEVSGAGEMSDSFRAALTAAPPHERVLLFPVDHALVDRETVAAVTGRLELPAAKISLPLWRERPGHPIALTAPVAAEVLDPATHSVRDVVRRDPERVVTVEVDDPWVCAGLNTPGDLQQAREFLRARG